MIPKDRGTEYTDDDTIYVSNCTTHVVSDSQELYLLTYLHEGKKTSLASLLAVVGLVDRRVSA